MKKYKIGFTDGVYDLFHVGHLNMIRTAKDNCEFLIVGVHSDEIVNSYKKHYPVINENDRKEIVESIRYVDKCVINQTRDKMELHNLYNFDVVFIGDDWKGTERWNKIEKDLNSIGVDVIYVPYTKGVSSTMIRERFIKNEK